MSKPSITRLHFETQYSDDSGVEFAVRFNSDDDACCGSVEGSIEIEHINKVSIPIDRLDWLQDCISKIKVEVGKNK